MQALLWCHQLLQEVTLTFAAATEAASLSERLSAVRASLLTDKPLPTHYYGQNSDDKMMWEQLGWRAGCFTLVRDHAQSVVALWTALALVALACRIIARLVPGTFLGNEEALLLLPGLPAALGWAMLVLVTVTATAAVASPVFQDRVAAWLASIPSSAFCLPLGLLATASFMSLNLRALRTLHAMVPMSLRLGPPLLRSRSMRMVAVACLFLVTLAAHVHLAWPPRRRVLTVLQVRYPDEGYAKAH
jgi:hypothetical protein